jgi:signal transduction histidine kinase
VKGYIDTLYALDRSISEGDYRIQTKHDGERVWSFASAPVGRDARGRRLVVSMAADLTNLRRAEEELRTSEERLRLATKGGGIGTWELDLVSGRGTWSEVAKRLLGRDLTEDTAETWPEVAHPDDRAAAAAAWQDAVERGVPYEVAFRPASSTATARWVISRGWVERDAAGRPVRGLGVVLDISTLRQTEGELRELAAMLERRVEERTRALSESVAELEAFAYTVSHDLRAPLRGMEGFAQALIEDYADSLGPRGQRYAERIAAAAQRMDGLIGDLLEYSRLSRSEVTVRPVDPAGVVGGALADVGEAIERTGAAVEVVTPMPEVLGSPPVLRQVLANLIGNAVKFVPNGEAPRVKVWAERSSPAQSDQVRLWVEDNGIGVEPEHRDRVFRVFERLHSDSVYPGTGIGLAIVRRGAERMGGSAGLEDRPDGERGSRFWVDLPAGA